MALDRYDRFGAESADELAAGAAALQVRRGRTSPSLTTLLLLHPCLCGRSGNVLPSDTLCHRPLQLHRALNGGGGISSAGEAARMASSGLCASFSNLSSSADDSAHGGQQQQQRPAAGGAGLDAAGAHLPTVVRPQTSQSTGAAFFAAAAAKVAAADAASGGRSHLDPLERLASRGGSGKHSLASVTSFGGRPESPGLGAVHLPHIRGAGLPGHPGATQQPQPQTPPHHQFRTQGSWGAGPLPPSKSASNAVGGPGRRTHPFAAAAAAAEAQRRALASQGHL